MSDIIEMKKRDFRAHREHELAKYDLLRTNILSGDLNPKTGLPYSPLSSSERQWRLEMCNFTDYITENTEASDYPQTPERIQNM